LLTVFVTAVLTAFGPVSAVAAVSPSATIIGTVTLTSADGATLAGEGVRLTLACGTETATRTDVADEDGTFRFLNVPVGSCSIEANVQGFVAPCVMVVTAAGETVTTDVHLGNAPLGVGVNVAGTPSSLAPKMPHRSCLSNRALPRERLATKCVR
jgi:hypothetical protein